MSTTKDEVITFKVDKKLAQALEGIPNRSEFIRNAILAAMDSVCPLCKGTGLLSPDQKRHWKKFAEHHAVAKCDDCQAYHIICDAHK